MVNRREFFSGLLKPKANKPGARPVRAPRYRTLETYVVADLIPYDLSLTPDQDRELRALVRRTLDATSDADLFSAAIVAKLETIAKRFVHEIERPGRFDPPHTDQQA